MTDFNKNIKEAIKKYKSKTPEQKAKEKKDLKKRKDAMKSTPKEKKLVKKINKFLKEGKPTRGGGVGGGVPRTPEDMLNIRSPGRKKPLMAGGGKVKSKFFTGGTVNPSYGTDFDDR
jgi:hypothetical protein